MSEHLEAQHTPQDEQSSGRLAEAEPSRLDSPAREVDELESMRKADEESAEVEKLYLESQAREIEETDYMNKADKESWDVRAFEKARQAEELDKMSKADEESFSHVLTNRRDDALKAEVASMVPMCADDRFHFWYDALCEITKGDDCDDEWPVILQDGVTRVQSFDAKASAVIAELETHDPQWEMLHIGYHRDASRSRPIIVNGRGNEETIALKHVLLPVCVVGVQGIIINGSTAARRILGVLQWSLQSSELLSVNEMLSGVDHHLRVYMSCELLVTSTLSANVSNTQLVRKQLLKMNKAVRSRVSPGIIGRFDMLRDALVGIVEEAEEGDHEVYFVAEDDVRYVDDFSSRLDVVLKELLSCDPQWDVLQVGFSLNDRTFRRILSNAPEEKKQASHIVRPMTACTPVGCAGFVVHGISGARRMLDILSDSQNLEDSFDFMYRKLRIYMSVEPLLQNPQEASILESDKLASAALRTHLIGLALFRVFMIDVSIASPLSTSLSDAQTLLDALEYIAVADHSSKYYLVVEGMEHLNNFPALQRTLQELQKHDPSWDALQVASSDISKVTVRPVQVEVSELGVRHHLTSCGRPHFGLGKFDGGFGAIVVHGAAGAGHLLRVVLDSSPSHSMSSTLRAIYTQLNVYVSIEPLMLAQTVNSNLYGSALNAGIFLQDPHVLDHPALTEEDAYKKLSHVRFQQSMYRLDQVDAVTAPGAMGLFARLEGALRDIIFRDEESLDDWYVLADADPIDEIRFLPDLTASLIEMQGYDARWDVLLIGFSADECQFSRFAYAPPDGITKYSQCIARPCGLFNITGLVVHGAWSAQRLLNLIEMHPGEQDVILTSSGNTLRLYMTTKPLIRGATSRNRRDASHHHYHVGEDELLDDLRGHARAQNIDRSTKDKSRHDRGQVPAEHLRYHRQVAPTRTSIT